MQVDELLQKSIETNVRDALLEDIGTGDVSGELINSDSKSTAVVITREAGVICGKLWADETLRQVDSALVATWRSRDGDSILPGTEIVQLEGSSRSLLAAERTMLNFLQLLSATATLARLYTQKVKHTNTVILDTRKTIPGLRMAQKYAVQIGGAQNHRIGLFDAFLIKENHIRAAGSISNAVNRARDQRPELLLEVEVESIEELEECVACGVTRALLDNFSTSQQKQAVKQFGESIELEASGNVTLETVAEIAETGVHYISSGDITKNVKALDLSMRFTYTKL